MDSVCIPAAVAIVRDFSLLSQLSGMGIRRTLIHQLYRNPGTGLDFRS